ncbi:type II toxin-antitoxin system Phd/YefM family antitoxin [Methylomagnum sp.]
MDTIAYATVRANLVGTMSRVCDNHEPIIITRDSEQPVVMISLDDYNALEETAYLLSNPVNARRLLESIAELESGGGAERELI